MYQDMEFSFDHL